MMGLFWRLFAVFWLAFIAIDIGHSFALRFIEESEVAAQPGFVLHALATYGAALPIAFVLSGFLAWYLNQPIRVMRRAFGAMSAGRLDTRVRHLLRSRRNDIVDLGRDFDGMAHRLEELVALRQSMLRDVSHELRSPLARMQTAIGLAQQNPDNILETLDRIESESLRLQAMLENMLTLAKIEAGVQQPAPREEIDLVELVAGIARDARFEAQARGCDLVLRVQGNCIRSAHPELLHRAFENIVRNAVKYTDGGTCVEIAVVRTASQLQVAIADRGPGVMAADLERIFEPFYRAPQPGQHTPGFGVGLAIARRAIEYHGGRVAAANRPGAGLVISVVLPL